MSVNISDSTDTRCISLVAALKAGRHALGWSQGELANHAGVSRVTIARMEAGMFKPRRATFEALLQAMDVAGVRITLGQPADGFTMAVEGRALPHAEGASSASSLEKAVLENLAEATVDLGSVGFPPVDKQAALKRLSQEKAEQSGP